MKKIYSIITCLFLTKILGAQCAIPSLVTATPATICAGTTTTLKATAYASSINWFTTPIGGVPIGTSLSAVNFTTIPTVSTTYYAESFVPLYSATTIFSYTPSLQTFTVPTGVTSVTISASGAEGCSTSLPGGKGGNATGVFTVTPGQLLYVYVGQKGNGFLGGYNGGGSPGGVSGTGGGGASDVRVGGVALINRILVAGGGGASTVVYLGGSGGTGSSCLSPFGVGGGYGSGCAIGNIGNCAGGTATLSGTGGGGGGLNSGGAISGDGTGGAGAAGSLGIGGDGGIGGGGGGGGGYYGGSGGHHSVAGCNGAGGGGSSYSSSSSTIFTGGVQSGNGVVQISWPFSCTSTSRTPVAVTVNTTPTISVTSGSICSGKSFSIVANGANTYTYNSGSAIVTPTVNSSYTITGANNGCASTSSAVSTVFVNANPTITVNSGNICIGQTFTIIPNGASTYTYSSGSSVVSPTVTTIYSVTGTDILGCISQSPALSIVIVNACTGIDELDINKSIILYPNPFTNEIYVKTESDIINKKYFIYNTSGQVIESGILNGNKINCSDFSKGLYFIKLEGTAKTFKLVKED